MLLLDARVTLVDLLDRILVTERLVRETWPAGTQYVPFIYPRDSVGESWLPIAETLVNEAPPDGMLVWQDFIPADACPGEA